MNVYRDDEQGHYYNELREILKGNLDIPINNDHEQALQVEINHLMKEPSRELSLPF